MSDPIHLTRFPLTQHTAPAETPWPGDGIHCGQATTCLDSRPAPFNSRRRRHVCKICCTRWTTYEVEDRVGAEFERLKRFSDALELLSPSQTEVIDALLAEFTGDR